MLKSCFKKGCTQVVNSACFCTEKPINLCRKHAGDHLSLDGEHQIRSFLVKLTSGKVSEISAKILESLEYLDKTTEDIRTHTQFLIESICKSSVAALLKVQEVGDKLCHLLVDALEQRDIDKEDCDTICKIVMPKTRGFENYLGVWTKITKTFRVNLFASIEDCDEVIFSKSTEEGGLWSIDLESFVVKSLDFVKIAGRGNSCRIGKGIYFFNAGGKFNKSSGETYIVNIKENSFEQLSPNIPHTDSGSVYKDDKVYVFGGVKEIGELKKCRVYKFKQSQWEDIHDLPVECCHNTASIVNKNIILTGFHADTVWAYDDFTYSSILKVSIDNYKVICNGWVITSEVLFENINSNILQWKTYQILWKPNALWSSCTFPRGKHIYFICTDDLLWRVDTEAKIIEKVSYHSS